MEQSVTQFLEWTYEGKQLEVKLELSDEVTVGHIQTKNKTKKVLPKKKSNAPKEVTVEPKKKKGCGSCASKGLKRLLTGGAKLLKSELGIDACDEATMIDRKNLCESCEHYDFGVCSLCGCFCAAKVKLKSELCPDERW